MNKIYPYAGFWKRAIAFLIDGIVLAIPSTLIGAFLIVPQVMSVVRMASANVEPSPEMMLPLMSKWMLSMVFIWISNIVLLWLYSAWMESSKYQATLGKMALGIKVVGAHGERISFARATGRTFAKFISHMILYFGDYMAGFTEKRQALHDMIATTYVVTKDYQQGQELPTFPFSKGGCAAGIVAAVAPVAFYILLIVASMFLAISEAQTQATHSPRPQTVATSTASV
ncbi:MAG: RDD family protein, partial [Elusimicrobiaceae bacterium]|nr:RDD family protein [Elusimicrobiaceae bacterium]